MQAYFTTLSGGNRRWNSTVRQVLPVPPKPLNESSQGGGSPASKSGSARVVLYTVLLDVDNNDQALMPEMTTQVFFVANQARDVLLAPIIALQGTTEGNRQTAHIVSKNGKVEPREIRTGISDRLRVEILEGLDEGDHLLVGPATGNGG